MKHMYLDNAAATPLDPQVVKEVMRGMGIIGNPSAFNDRGREAFAELQKARQSVARFLGAHPEEIIFTASGSEANTMAILDVLRGSGRRSGTIITSAIEHKSVLEPVRALADQGYSSHILSVDAEGYISMAELEKSLTNTTLLVSVMYANNEIGSIQPIIQIGKAIKKFRRKNGAIFPLFHIDACQAALSLPMDVNQLGADLLTFNASKMYGPRGAAVLYVRKGVKIVPRMLGGAQEHGLRAGTENLPAILGLARAISLIKNSDTQKMTELRDLALAGIEKALPDVKVNGSKGEMRLANNINISIPGLGSEQLLLELDKYGIAAGSGSACTARSVEPSHVLRAIGNRPPYLEGALRFSLGRETTRQDIEHLLKVMPKIVDALHRRYDSLKENS
jgi:cysteine desulfurase